MPANEDYDGMTADEIAHLVQENDELASKVRSLSAALTIASDAAQSQTTQIASLHAERDMLLADLREALDFLQRGLDLADEVGLDLGWQSEVDLFIKEHTGYE